MKTFKRNKKQTRKLNKRSRRSSYIKNSRNKSRARGWFRKTPEPTNLEDWINLKADKLNDILIKIFNKMDHNKTCTNPATRKKYMFTKCEKPIDQNMAEAEQIIQALNANIQLNINTPNFNPYKYLKIFEDRAKMFNTDISEFNTFQKNLFNSIINFNKYESIKTLRQSSRLKTAIEETGTNLESKSRLKLRSLFLQSICSDTGYCMTFGQEDTKIKNFFKGFTTFEYAIDPILLKGEISKNGFINQITYEREGYKAYTILKSSKRAAGDNLMYEYKVGQYINTWTKKLPCFVETYGLFKYATDAAGDNFYAAMQTVPASFPDTYKNVDELKNSVRLFPNIDWKTGCLESQKFAILIQHFDNIETLEEWIARNTNVSGRIVNSTELMHILFQIYIPLGLLHDTFTHYDLHQNNVLIYTPSSGKMIKYKYHIPQTYVNKLGLSSNLIEFDSPYIVKIIDYGRCYFNMSASNNALTIYNEICATTKCDPTCGINVGFMWNGPVDLLRKSNQVKYLSAQTNNPRYDLGIANYFQNIALSDELGINILFKWGKIISPSEISTHTIHHHTTIVTTVYELLESICDYSRTTIQTVADDTFIGTLDIFVDKDMVFKPTKEFKEIERIRRSQFKEVRKNTQKLQSEANNKLKSDQFKEDIIKSKHAYIKKQLEQQLAPINEKLSEENQILSQEQELARLAQIAQEEERQRLILANMPFKSRRLKNQIKESISKTKQEIISKSNKNKQFTITDMEGKKQTKRIVSRPLSQLQELSNSNSNSSNETSS